MAAFVIEGGHPLSGTITPQGAKNEALQVICATLLTSEAVTIHNIPTSATSTTSYNCSRISG